MSRERWLTFNHTDREATLIQIVQVTNLLWWVVLLTSVEEKYENKNCGVSWLLPLWWRECLNERPWLMPAVDVKWRGVHKMFQMYHTREKFTTCVWNCYFIILYLWNNNTRVQLHSPHLGVIAFNLWFWHSVCPSVCILVQSDFHI